MWGACAVFRSGNREKPEVGRSVRVLFLRDKQLSVVLNMTLSKRYFPLVDLRRRRRRVTDIITAAVGCIRLNTGIVVYGVRDYKS